MGGVAALPVAWRKGDLLFPENKKARGNPAKVAEHGRRAGADYVGKDLCVMGEYRSARAKARTGEGSTPSLG